MHQGGAGASRPHHNNVLKLRPPWGSTRRMSWANHLTSDTVIGWEICSLKKLRTSTCERRWRHRNHWTKRATCNGIRRCDSTPATLATARSRFPLRACIFPCIRTFLACQWLTQANACARKIRQNHWKTPMGAIRRQPS